MGRQTHGGGAQWQIQMVSLGLPFSLSYLVPELTKHICSDLEPVSPVPSRGRKLSRSTRARGTRSMRLQVEIEAPKIGLNEDQNPEETDVNGDSDEEGTDAGKEDSDAAEEPKEEPEESPVRRGRPRGSRTKHKKGIGPGIRRTGRRR